MDDPATPDRAAPALNPLIPLLLAAPSVPELACLARVLRGEVDVVGPGGWPDQDAMNTVHDAVRVLYTLHRAEVQQALDLSLQATWRLAVVGERHTAAYAAARPLLEPLTAGLPHGERLCHQAALYMAYEVA